MDFLFGIEKEAEIYCTSSIVSMKQQWEKIEPNINQSSLKMVEDGLEFWDYDEVVEFICFWTKRSVIDSGWDVCDEAGVAWFMGMLCESYVRSLRNSVCPYEKIFKSCFISYFKNK